MLTFLQNALNASPIIGALLAVALINARRTQRARQYLMPAVAVAYLVVALILLHRFNTWVDGLIEQTVSYLPMVRDIYSTSWLYILENTAAVTVFFAVKLAFKPVLAGIMSRRAGAGEAIVGRVYAFDKEYGTWFVARRFDNLREFYRNAYLASIVITVVFTACALTLPQWPAFIGTAFPALAALVIGEFYFAINGLTRQEFRQDILGEGDDARRIVNYSALREVLRQAFPGRVLADGVVLASADATDSFARLDSLERSPDEIEQIAAKYFKRLKANGEEIDTNLVDAALALMRRQSVVINNPFYADLRPYLALPVYFHLLQYGKCLVIAGRDTLADDLADWIRAGLEDITGLSDLWLVDVLSQATPPDVDVAVLRFADLHNVELVEARDDFLSAVECVILAEPSRMLGTGQLGLAFVLSRCGRSGAPVFAAFDRNLDGLVDALSHLLKTNLTEVVASALPRGSSAEMVWEASGPHMHTSILPAITRFLGQGTEISAVALKHHVSNVSWVGGDRFPVQDMMWIASQYYAQINSFADLEVSQDALENSVTPFVNPWAVPQSNNAFMIVEDDLSNVYESIRLYATRATNAGFINFISGDYMLRDYMLANREIFSSDPKAIPTIVPDFARTERNAVLRLTLTLLAFDISEVDLERQLVIIGRLTSSELYTTSDGTTSGEPPCVGILRALVRLHTGIEELYISTSVRRAPLGDGEEAVQRFFRLHHDAALDSVLNALRSAFFYVEDETEREHYIGALLYGHVYQALLPGQFIAYAGKYYEVQAIGSASHGSGVILRRAAEHLRDRRTYRQLRTYSISDLRPQPGVGARISTDGMEILRLFGTIRVATHGYLETLSSTKPPSTREVHVSGVPERAHANKALLEIRLPDSTPATRRTIALLLNELFVTTFPDTHQYVVALTRYDDGLLGDVINGLACDEGGEDAIFIVEDSVVDMGLLVAIERNWRRLLETITDYLAWYSTPLPEPTDPPPGDVWRLLPAPSSDVDEQAAARARRPRRLHRLIARMRRRPQSPPEALEADEVPPGAEPGPRDETATVHPGPPPAPPKDLGLMPGQLAAETASAVLVEDRDAESGEPDPETAAEQPIAGDDDQAGGRNAPQ